MPLLLWTNLYYFTSGILQCISLSHDFRYQNHFWVNKTEVKISFYSGCPHYITGSRQTFVLWHNSNHLKNSSLMDKLCKCSLTFKIMFNLERNIYSVLHFAKGGIQLRYFNWCHYLKHFPKLTVFSIKFWIQWCNILYMPFLIPPIHHNIYKYLLNEERGE